MTQASVIIVNYNSGDRLQRCLDCLEKQRFRGFEIVVVDNASSDGSLEFARRGSVRIIEAGANLGFAAGNNLAVKEAAGDWVAFLNPDAYARDDWLENLMAATKRYPHVEAFGSTQLNAVNPSIIDGAGDVMHILGLIYRGHFGWPAEQLPPEGECFAPCAAAALYRRETFERLGGFDESFFCYGEDVDLGFRLRLNGGRAVQVANAVVLHEGSGVTGRASDFTVYHGNRNRIWLTYKNMPAAFYWPLFPMRFIADLYLLIRWSLIGRGGAYFRALRDGYGGLAAYGKARKRVQQGRTVPLGVISRSLSWSILAISTRRAKLWRPIEGDQELR